MIKKVSVRSRKYSFGYGVKAFTLVEVMVAVSILALGSALIYEAFFTSLDLFGYYEDYVNIAPWANELIWRAQNALSSSFNPGPIETSGLLPAANRQYAWELSYAPLDEVNQTHKLYKINLSVQWRSGKRSLSLSRDAYALYANATAQ